MSFCIELTRHYSGSSTPPAPVQIRTSERFYNDAQFEVLPWVRQDYLVSLRKSLIESVPRS